ncbi:MAG: hypothetical protein V3T32_03840 [Thermodesulfobacteriota bacterium]
MRISKSVREMEGVNQAVAVMATEKAKFALEDAGLITPEIKEAKGSDLVMIVEADTEKVAESKLAYMQELLSLGLSKSESKSSDILNQELRTINIGLDIFKEALEAQGVKVVQVDWEVPAKGDEKIINILKKMY